MPLYSFCSILTRMTATRTRAKKRRARLATLRGEVRNMTQVQVASACGLFQTDVSRLEHRETLDGVSVSTLRRYIEGLGGELRLVAMVNGRAYELTGNDEE